MVLWAGAATRVVEARNTKSAMIDFIYSPTHEAYRGKKLVALALLANDETNSWLTKNHSEPSGFGSPVLGSPPFLSGVAPARATTKVF
jgi:hypothetical protein